jgi:tetratricopeptide (TPR) repeat protein
MLPANGIRPEDLSEPARPLLLRAEKLRKERAFAESTALIDQAIAEIESRNQTSDIPTLVEAYICRGVNSAQQGDLDQAIHDFTYATNLNPQRSLAYYNIGVLCEERDEYDRALIEYSTAITHSEWYYNAYVRRGRLLKRLSRDSEARKDFAKLRYMNGRIRERRSKDGETTTHGKNAAEQ